MNNVLQNFVGWALAALVALTLEMRLEVAKQGQELQAIAVQQLATAKLAQDSWEETLRRKDVIDWVREFRQANGWDNGDKNYLLKRGQK